MAKILVLVPRVEIPGYHCGQNCLAVFFLRKISLLLLNLTKFLSAFDVLFQFSSTITQQMAREMDVILGQQTAQPAKSCTSENGVSFLDQVITPLYEVVAAVCL